MKASRHLFVLLMLVQAALFTGMARAGTINNPDVIVNGQLETLTGDNWYIFSLVEDGNILVTGSGISIWLYDSNLLSLPGNPSVARTLAAGDYYMNVGREYNNRTFRLNSTVLDPGQPTHDYLRGYDAGYDEGEVAGYDAGYNAGYAVGEQEGGFYVIPFSVPAK